MSPTDAGAIVYALRVESPALQAQAQRSRKAMQSLDLAGDHSARIETIKAALDAKLIDLESAIMRGDPVARLLANEASTYAETLVDLTRRLTGSIYAAEGYVRTAFVAHHQHSGE